VSADEFTTGDSRCKFCRSRLGLEPVRLVPAERLPLLMSKRAREVAELRRSLGKVLNGAAYERKGEVLV
jgi:hypothetical protein